MTESCRALGAQTILPQPVVTKRYKDLAPDAGRGSGAVRCHWDGGLREMHGPAYEPGRFPLRHWLRREPSWEVLARAGLTHPRRLSAAALRAGLPLVWDGRRRCWSWAELMQLAAVAAVQGAGR